MADERNVPDPEIEAQFNAVLTELRATALVGVVFRPDDTIATVLMSNGRMTERDITLVRVLHGFLDKLIAKHSGSPEPFSSSRFEKIEPAGGRA